MARKTYYGLKYDGEHLEDGDHLLIHGIKYEVCTHPYYFLHATGLSHSHNGIVFEKVFGLSIDETTKWAEKYKSLGYGFFPEFEKEEDFRKFIISIYERPEYKVGDYVTILERTHNVGDYPFSFTNNMTNYCGRTYKIEGVESSASYNIEDYVLYNGDPQIYRLDGECISYSWHQSMFRKATESEIEAYKKSKGESKVDYNPGVIKVDAGLDIGTTCQCCDSSSSIIPPLENARAKLDRMMETIRSFKPRNPAESVDLRDSKLRLPKDINKTPHINL